MVPGAHTSELRLAANSAFLPVRSRDRALHTDSRRFLNVTWLNALKQSGVYADQRLAISPHRSEFRTARDITFQAESSSEARRIVMEMIPGALVTAVKRRVK